MFETGRDSDMRKILMYNIRYVWLLCRYTRGNAGKMMHPILMYLIIDRESQAVEWMPLKLEDETPMLIYSTAAALLQDENVPVVLFLTDTYTDTKVPEHAYMMVSFTCNGLGPVVTSSVHSCRVLNKRGPKIKGNYSDDENQDAIQDYLDEVEEDIVMGDERLPVFGYQISELEKIEIDGVSSEVFLSLLENFNISENNLT